MLQSKYAAFNVRTHDGHWRQLTLRTNELHEILAIVIFDKQDLSVEDIDQEKKHLGNYFLKFLENDQEFRLKGLLFNLNTNKLDTKKIQHIC